MSALVFRTLRGGKCADCHRAAARTPEIAGYPLRHERSPFADDRIRICLPCAKAWERRWEELAA